MAAVDWLPASEYPFGHRFIEVGLAARRPELFRADFRLAAARVSLDPPSTPLREWLALPVRQRELQPDVRASATSFGLGRHLSAEGRRAFLVPWRRHAARMMTLRNLGNALTADAWLDEVAHAIDTTH